jgi:hypothetical protein
LASDLLRCDPEPLPSAVAGSPLVVFVLADAVSWLIDIRRDHCPGISG